MASTAKGIAPEVNVSRAAGVGDENPQLSTPLLARIQAGDPRAALPACSPLPTSFFQWLASPAAALVSPENFRGGVALTRICRVYLCC